MTDILIVEDNSELQTLMKDFLLAEGYTVKTAGSGKEALEIYRGNKVNLVLLDIMLPDMDGLRVCSKIRENGNTPVLIISAKNGKEDKLNGLYTGADDYIEKPFDIDILLAKISGIFKRRYSTDIITDGNLKIDLVSHTAYVDDKPLSLTSKEFELLKLLVENKGRTLKKEYVFNKIWGFDSFSEPQTLTVHIKWLRQKIEENPKNPKRIITVWGVGDRFE